MFSSVFGFVGAGVVTLVLTILGRGETRTRADKTELSTPNQFTLIKSASQPPIRSKLGVDYLRSYRCAVIGPT